MRFIFESNLPGWLPATEQARRIAQWQAAGLDAVMVQVDAGTGSCWPSSIMPKDSRVNLADEPLRRFVDGCHEAGLTVVLDFTCGLFATYINPPIKPEYTSPALAGFYNYWNADFRAWKSDAIAECAAYVDADAVALDYLRTGRDPQSGEAPSAEVVLDFLAQVRLKVDAGYPLISVNNAVYATSTREGVNLAGWLASGAVEHACVFNYSYPYPVHYVAHLDAAKLWVLSGNYDFVNGAATPRVGRTLGKDWRQIIRQVGPAGIGLYLANLLNDDQAKHLAWTGSAL